MSDHPFTCPECESDGYICEAMAGTQPVHVVLQCPHCLETYDARVTVTDYSVF